MKISYRPELRYYTAELILGGIIPLWVNIHPEINVEQVESLSVSELSNLAKSIIFTPL